MKTYILCFAGLLLIGCAGTPKPGGRDLVSVSFVNPGPASYAHLRLALDGSPTAARLPELGPYREEWQEFSQALSERPRLNLSWVSEGQTVMAPVQYLAPPARRAGDGRYHMRVHLQGVSFVAELEPHTLARNRWILQGNGEE